MEGKVGNKAEDRLFVLGLLLKERMGATQGFRIIKEEILEEGGWGRGGGGERGMRTY